MYDLMGWLKPFERLAAAIVRQAALDYLEAYKKYRQCKRGSIAWERCKTECYLCEKWFYSEWADALTMGHGEAVLDMVKRGCLD